MDRFDVINEIVEEIHNQNSKWGHVEKDVTGWLLVVESELNEAKEGWVKQKEGKHSTRNELIQVAAGVIQCLEIINSKQ